MRSAFALRIFSGRNIYNFAILENLRIFQNCLFTGRVGTNSLSQSLTALTAPSGREPLARPETLHLSLKLCRHAKGPISEGAVAVGDWGSFSRRAPSPSSLRDATSPKGRGKSTAESVLIVPNTLASRITAWLSLRESWRGSA